MEDTINGAVSRRSFLKKSAVVGGSVAALALLEGPAFMFGKELAQAANSDLDMMIFNGGLEALAQKAYQTAAGLNLLEKPVLDAALKIVSQHREHQLAFESAAKRLGGTPVPLEVTKYPALKSQADILEFARTLEMVATGAYFIAIGKLKDPQLVTLTASIMPIELHHATILSAALKQDTIPEAFPVGKKQDEINTIATAIAVKPQAAAAGQGGAAPASGGSSTTPAGAPASGIGGASAKDDNNSIVVATLAAIGAATAGFLALRKRGESTESEKSE